MMKRSLPILSGLIGLLLLVSTGLLLDNEVKAQWSPGDTVRFVCAVPDTDGAGVDPTSLTLFILERGAILDSSNTKGSGLTEVSDHGTYEAAYVIPSGIGEETNLEAYVKYSGGGYTNSIFPGASPRTIHVGGGVSGGLVDGAVDSLTNNAIQDLWTGIESSNYAILDSSDGGGIYQASSPVSGAAVWVTSSSTWSGGTILGFWQATVNGNYWVTIPISPVAADTVYVWAWYQNTFLKEGTEVAIP